MEAEHAVKRIYTFDRTEANRGEMLYVSVPKLNKNKVIMPGLLALRLDIDLSGGHANNFLVQNITRALVDKLVVKFAGTILQETVMTSTKSSRTFSYRRKSETTCCLREFRARTYVRSTQVRGTRKHQVSPLKTN